MKKYSLYLIFIVTFIFLFVLTTYSKVSAVDGLVASYSFDENSGVTAQDSSGNNNNGSTNGTAWTTSGKYGNALSFNGSTNYVTVNDSNSLDLTNAMTLEAWVKPVSLSSWRSILLKEKSGNLNYALYANTDSDRPSVEINNGSSNDTRGAAKISTGVWTHLAGTYDGSTLKLYINGNLVSSKSVSGAATTSSNPLRIGGNTVWGEYFNGLIDEVRIYNKALSQSEIQTDMNTPINSALSTSTPSPTGNITPTPSYTPTPTPNSTDAQFGKWEPLMNWPLVAVHAVLMYNGKVLMWDGWEIPSYARVWDPANNSFAQYTNQDGLFCSGHSTLSDGRILVAGGHAENLDGIRDTNIFDPVTNTWQSAADMYQKRWYPSVTTLNDGKVLALSGYGDEANPDSDTPEIYNPTNNSWTQLSDIETSDMHDPMYPHPYVLQNGTLFVTSPAFGTSRRLSVGAQTWTDLPTNPVKYGTPVMYQLGKFMVSGGGSSEGSSAQKNTTVIDMNSGSPSWRNTSQMNYPRYHHNNVILPDGKVLAVGGAISVEKNEQTGTLPAELWNPDTETWVIMASMSNPRMYHSIAMLMPDGRVLSAGGGRYGSATNYLTAQYFDPPYLFKGARPTISSMSGSTLYNSSFNINSPDAANIATVSMVSLGSVTHTLDMNQRFIKLNFTKSGNTLNVTSPLNSNYAPPGYYMIFILNSNGVPSVAKIIQIINYTQPTPTISPTPTPTTGSSPTPTPTSLPSSGLVVSFNFNENAGSTLNDGSGNNNNGSTNGTAWTTSGKYGNALSFNGSTNYVTVNDSNSLDLTNAMTLEAWVKPVSLSSWRSILLKEKSGNLNYALYANTDSDRPSVEINNGSSNDTRGAAKISTGVWTHLAGTYDGSTLKLYINGNLVSSKSVSGAATTSSNPLRIGGNTVWGEYFNGLIDEVRIYNKALSQSEIQTDMNTPL